MSIEIPTSFKTVYEEIQNQCAIKITANSFEFKQLLVSLSCKEQTLATYFFCKSPWNVGSLRVLSVLQQLRMLTATQFILSLDDAVETQLILNDFLEAEYELIVNLFSCAYHNMDEAVGLHLVLDECLRRLFVDLLQQPKLNNLDYLLPFSKCKLQQVELLTFLMQKHVLAVLQLQENNIKDAFRNYTSWINESVDELQFNKDLYNKLLHAVQEQTLSYIFKLSSAEHFKHWKFYLVLLQTIASKCTAESAAYIRKYLKNRLRFVASSDNKNCMLHLLLSVRAATATTMDIESNINAYADWYKQNISDMKFVFKQAEFQNVIELLQQTVDYEQQVDYLQVHATCNISPPINCGRLVQLYKSKCKTRLSQLKANAEPQSMPESIAIDSE